MGRKPPVVLDGASSGLWFNGWKGGVPPPFGRYADAGPRLRGGPARNLAAVDGVAADRVDRSRGGAGNAPDGQAPPAPSSRRVSSATAEPASRMSPPPLTGLSTLCPRRRSSTNRGAVGKGWTTPLLAVWPVSIRRRGRRATSSPNGRPNALTHRLGRMPANGHRVWVPSGQVNAYGGDPCGRPSWRNDIASVGATLVVARLGETTPRGSPRRVRGSSRGRLRSLRAVLRRGQGRRATPCRACSCRFRGPRC